MASDDSAEDAADEDAAVPASAPPDDDARKPSAPPRRTATKAGTSTAKSRAAQRKVKLPGADDAPAPAPAPRKVTKPPFYRRGGFWALVILAEVLVALFLSYRFEPSTTSVDLTGANVDAFCATVKDVRAASPQDTIDVSNADAVFRRQREAYQKLKQSAPDELQPDLDRMIKSSDQLVSAAQDIQRKKAENPSYLGGVSDLIAAQSAADQRLEVPSARLSIVARDACNIDLSVPAPPTTTVPTGGPVSTSTPGAPGPNGGGAPAPGPADSTAPR